MTKNDKKRKITLSLSELQHFSDAPPPEFSFDFSRIPSKDFEIVLASIVKYAKNDITKLSFTLDTFYETSSQVQPNMPAKRGKPAPREPVTLTNSAFRRSSNFNKSLLLCLSHVLPKSESITHLTFRSLVFGPTELQQLGVLVGKCQNLKEFTIQNVALYDSGIPSFILSLKRKSMYGVHFINCGLSDECLPTLKNLLSYNLSIQKEAEWQASLELDGVAPNLCMSVLDLRNNNFTYHLFMEFNDVLCDLPLHCLDIRGNKPLEPKLIQNERKMLSHIEILTNSDNEGNLPKSSKKGGAYSRRASSVPGKTSSKKSRSNTKEAPSIEMNPPRHLRNVGSIYSIIDTNINRTDESQRSSNGKDNITLSSPVPFKFDDTSQNVEMDDDVEEVMIAPDLKVIGKRAKEFAEYVKTLCSLLEKYQGNFGQIQSLNQTPSSISAKQRSYKKNKRSRSVSTKKKNR